MNICIQFSPTVDRATDDDADIDGGCGDGDMKKIMYLCAYLSE